MGTLFRRVTHDCDVNEKGEPVEDHVHVMMSFENIRSINSIAKALGDKPQYLQMWKGQARNAYAYLIHATRGSIEKHQYSPSKIIANFNYLEEILK